MELEKANAELDRFVYSASHDMRAPLSTLLGLLELARLNKNDPKEISRYFEMMTDRIHTMEGFIREITDYSRNARLEIKTETVNIKSVIDEVIHSFELLANEAGVEFDVKVDQNPDLHISTDTGRLKVVLNNLIANAIKYHDPLKSKRFVKIQATAPNSLCAINITDNGSGIEQEYHDKIFDMFFRASEKSNGSGLGLYIVKQTVEKLGGTITLESKVHIGTKITVDIPNQKGNN